MADSVSRRQGHAGGAAERLPMPALDSLDEAQRAAAVLGRNYPESFWYKQSLRLLGRENRQVDRRTASRK